MQRIKGSREAFNYLAEKYGDRFLFLYTWRTFSKRVELCEVPHMHQDGHHRRKTFSPEALETWFLKGFTDPDYAGGSK